MLNLNSVMIGSMKTKELAAFYEMILGKPPDMIDHENGFYGWQAGTTFLTLLEHSEMEGSTKDPGRVILNFEAADVKGEFERIKSLGGTVIREPYEM